jgi:hypothetical protein
MADVHIQNISPPCNLSFRELLDVFKVLFHECLPQFLDARGIDLLPNDHKRLLRPDDHFLGIAFEYGVHVPSL